MRASRRTNGASSLGRAELLGGTDTRHTEQHMVVAPLFDKIGIRDRQPEQLQEHAHGQRRRTGTSLEA
jgi:hypothetical protein